MIIINAGSIVPMIAASSRCNCEQKINWNDPQQAAFGIIIIAATLGTIGYFKWITRNELPVD